MGRLQAILAGADTVPALKNARAEDPKDPAPLIKLGLKYQARHDRDRALELYEEAVRLDPKGARTMTRDSGQTVSCKELAEFHHAQTFVTTFGLYDIDAVKEFIKTHPRSPLLKDAYTEISRFHHLSDKEGRVFLDEFVSKFPTDPDVLKIYIDKIKSDHRGPEGARDLYQRGMTFADRIGEAYPSITPVEASRSLAQLAIDSQDPARAEAEFGPEFMAGQTRSWADALMTYAEFWISQKRNRADSESSIAKALSLAPDDPEIRRRAAAARHFHLGETGKALEVYGPDLLPTLADSAPALYSYFKFWTQIGTNVESAEQALEMLFELKPETVYYRIGAASVYMKPGPLDKSLAVFGPDFIATKADDPAVLYDYGSFWVSLGFNLESAIPALTKALRASPNVWTNHFQAAQLLARLKKPEAALEVFGPDYLPQIADAVDGLAAYARFWIDQGTNKESALEALEMALRIKDLPLWQMSQLAYGFVQAGRSERVEEFYGPDLVDKIGGDPLSLYLFASFWYHRGSNFASALAAIERACAIKKTDVRNWTIRARLLAALGRPADALEALEKAMSLDKYQSAREEHDQLKKQILAVLDKLKR